MMADPIGIDATGTEILKEAAETLLNSYPGTQNHIPFEDLREYGITFSPKYFIKFYYSNSFIQWIITM
jgi:hypothetical protein